MIVIVGHTFHYHSSISFMDLHIGWMMLWLSKRPEWADAKELLVSTHSFGVGDLPSLVEAGEDGDSQNKIRFLPTHDRTASLWYQGHYVRLSRSLIQEGVYVKETLTVK
jgi:chaperone BCS1